MTREEFFDALSALADGTIDPARHAALEKHLEADPEARQAYFQYLDLHLSLGKPVAPAVRRRRVQPRQRLAPARLQRCRLVHRQRPHRLRRQLRDGDPPP